MSDITILELNHISKHFPGVQALDDVTIHINQGEVHGLVGENGAGKSTLMNILGGVITPDSGTIRLNGENESIPTPAKAQNLGITFIHQELALFQNLSVASNIMISSLPQLFPGVIDDKQVIERSKEILRRVSLDKVNPKTKLRNLRPGAQQLVEIGQALSRSTKILVLDEPTSSLTAREIDTLFSLIRELKTQGVTIFYISHRLDEVFEICDRVSVLRDGKKITTVSTQEIDRPKLVHFILGHEIDEDLQHGRRSIGGELLRIEGFSIRKHYNNVSLTLKKGEILGITGLLGSGRTELFRAVFGLERQDTGEIWVNGRKTKINSPQDAIRQGIGFVTEDRRKEGIVLNRSIAVNITLASLNSFASQLGWLKPKREISAAEEIKKQLRISAPSVLRRVKNLSGGNQQKVVVGKWLQTHPQVFILDEPTRGIDIGAKAEVYRIINELAETGAGIILISSEIPEIVRLSDRAIVMRSGKIVAEFNRDELTASNILLAAVGGSNNDKSN